MKIFSNKIAKRFPILSRFVVFILLPVTVLIYFKINTWMQSLPLTSEQLTIKGIDEVVELKRDKQGVSYINAQTDHDAFFAMGYVHAQDRLWQLELQRRIASGTLSEVFGGDRLAQDSWMRALGIYHSAEQAWQYLSPEAQASLTAYTQGINRYLELDRPLPVEFGFLDITPKPWTEIDSLAWTKIFALNLANNMWSEISQLSIDKLLKNKAIRQLLEIKPEVLNTTVTNQQWQKMQTQIDALTGMNGQLQSDLKIGGKFVGSNAWVVSGKHTKSGQAILANDPHLGLQIPSLWYAAVMKGKTLDVAGMTLVGLPLVIFGQNQSIAWGGTSMGADVQDVYFELVNPENEQQYSYEGQWRDFEVRYETINVQAEMPASLREKQQPAKIAIRSTVNGPVISDFGGPYEMPMSLRWTALEAKDTTYDSFYRLNYAQDWQQFNAALAYHVAPTLNLLYADKQNNIGYVAAGKIPIRTGHKGATPVSGWQGEHKWQGYIPFEKMPKSYNPVEGYIINANNKIVGDEYPFFISQEWALPARFERIKQLLDEKINQQQPIDLAYVQQMQGDTMDLSSLELLSKVKQFKGTTSRQNEAMAYIKNWQGDMNESSQGASIFHVWMRHFRFTIMQGELSQFWNNPRSGMQARNFTNSINYQQLARLLDKKVSQNCHDVASCDQSLSDALDLALDEIEKFLVEDMEDWQWSKLQSTVYEHVPFSQVKFLDLLYERTIPSSGSVNSINVASASFNKSNGYEQKFGAGFRQIMSPGDEDKKHLYINSTGQSGNVFSEHYDDMVVPFKHLELFEMDTINKLSVNEQVTLTPKR